MTTGVAILLLYAFYVPNEIRTYKKIPINPHRVASLTPRSIGEFFPSRVIVFAHVLVAGIFLTDCIFLATGTIYLQKFIANIVIQVLFIGMFYIMFAIIKSSKSIHKKAISRISNEDISAGMRKINTGIAIVGFYIVIGLGIIGLITQFFHYEFYDPYMKWLLTLMNTTDSMPVIFTSLGNQIWALSGTILSILFFLWFPKSEAIRKVEALSFTKK